MEAEETAESAVYIPEGDRGKTDRVPTELQKEKKSNVKRA